MFSEVNGSWTIPITLFTGIEHVGEILGTKGLPIDFLNSILTDAILSDNTVASIQELSSSLDRATRVATVKFTCTLKTGETMRRHWNYKYEVGMAGLTEQGFQVKSYDDIRENLENRFGIHFGAEINTSVGSRFGTIIDILPMSLPMLGWLW